MKKLLITISLLASLCASLLAYEKPKIIDASYDAKEVVVTVFYRDSRDAPRKMYVSTPEIIINGKKYIINESDTFVTESQTGKRNIIVEFVFNIPENLKNVSIEKASLRYSDKENSPPLEVRLFNKLEK